MIVARQLRWLFLLPLLFMGDGNANAQKGSSDAVAVVRSKLASARRALKDKGKSLDDSERRSLDEALTQAENALKRYEELARRGNARKEAMAPLLIAGGGILADDATGVGVADDVLLPFIALGAVVAYVSTQASASDAELNNAWKAVRDKLTATGQVAERVASRRKRKTCNCICGKKDAPDRRPLGYMAEWECRSKCVMERNFPYNEYTCE
jgi:hypothetical protein